MPRLLFILVLAAGLVSLGGCRSLSTLPDVAVDRQPRGVTIEPPAQSETLLRYRWLWQAEEALAADRLFTPVGDSAYDLYRRVLQRWPQEPEALQGLDTLYARLLTLAETALREGRFERAEALLQQAGQLARDGRWRRLHEQLQQPRVQAGATLVLAPQLLAQRSEELVAQLQALAWVAQSQQSRLLIVAPNDREGRWIYQTMRAALHDGRLRGNIQLGSPARVELIDLEDAVDPN